MRLINCERENERAKFNAEVDAKIAARESVPWDWADYEAVGAMAQHVAIYESSTTPVADVLDHLQFELEGEEFRAGLAETMRRIADSVPAA